MFQSEPQSPFLLPAHLFVIKNQTGYHVWYVPKDVVLLSR